MDCDIYNPPKAHFGTIRSQPHAGRWYIGCSAAIHRNMNSTHLFTLISQNILLQNRIIEQYFITFPNYAVITFNFPSGDKTFTHRIYTYRTSTASCVCLCGAIRTGINKWLMTANFRLQQNNIRPWSVNAWTHIYNDEQKMYNQK